ncbi:MAG: ATP-grasp domain-containing protein [Clostridia bacterium]|nr:ATP-grasp domain-containing protein [Clostridia bacterium]
MSKTIAVIFGGNSNENEISVITGTMAANVLESGGESVIPVYLSQNSNIYAGQSLKEIAVFKDDGYKKAPRAVIADGGVYVLNARGRIKKFIKVDAALNCCHGGFGEGGGVSGLCQIAKIPLASAQVFESSAFIDKYLTKLILKSLEIKTAEFAYLKSMKELETCPNIPNFPLIVKPVTLGSSIGVEKAENEEELKNAVECGLLYDGAVILEEYLQNRREINCAAYYYDGEVITSECEEAITQSDVLSFEDKYTGGGKSVLPADLPADISGAIKQITQKVYKNLNMRGIVRFDFILSGGEIYLSEVNTVPGSLSYYLLSGGFKDFYRVLSQVIKQAQTDFDAVQSKKLIKTGILANVPSNACKLPHK